MFFTNTLNSIRRSPDTHFETPTGFHYNVLLRLLNMQLSASAVTYCRIFGWVSGWASGWMLLNMQLSASAVAFCYISEWVSEWISGWISGSEPLSYSLIVRPFLLCFRELCLSLSIYSTGYEPSQRKALWIDSLHAERTLKTTQRRPL